MKKVIIIALSIIMSVPSVVLSNSMSPMVKNANAWDNESVQLVVAYRYKTQKGPMAKNAFKEKEEESRQGVVNKRSTLKGPKAKNKKPFNK